jgi:hypothetical protein
LGLLLKTKNEMVIIAALSALGNLATKAAPRATIIRCSITKLLVKCLQQPNPVIKYNASRVLVNMA